MDEFGLERPELNGTVMTLEFGTGGRVQKLWTWDPNLPDETEPFQFVLPAVTIGEEFSEDYHPGTILLGARTRPEDPWILSRNSTAEIIDEDEESTAITFEYVFDLLPEIRVVGSFYELPGAVPQVAWDLRIINRGRVSLEIGELAFPFALNNLCEGTPDNYMVGEPFLHDRVHVHKFVGGAASYLFATRMSGEPPGLLIFPGDETTWELATHVPASLHSPYRWEGIPVVYVYSRAAVEREGWSGWYNEHTSLVLEPGDSRLFQTRFVSTGNQSADSLHLTLTACGRPTIRLLPSAVAPAEVGAGVEITGATPTRFWANRDAELETDSDEEGGFCFVKPSHPGALRLTFEDAVGRLSHCHLMFVEPIEKLIKSRAKWIVGHQVVDNPSSSLHHAIVSANVRTGEKITDPESYTGPFGLESGLSDALYLAEKNSIYPDTDEIAVLDNLIDHFLVDDVQNPGDGSVGSAFADFGSVALNFGRAPIYPIVFGLYHAMYRIGRTTGTTRRAPVEYLKDAAQTVRAMFRWVDLRGGGVHGYPRVHDLIVDLRREGMESEAAFLEERAREREREVASAGLSMATATGWDPSGIEELFVAAKHRQDPRLQETVMRALFSARSLAASWWWYGCDIRVWDESNGAILPNMIDRGEISLGFTTPANSLTFFDALDRDYGHLSEAHLRLAFGGMMAPWALVRSDGAASMGFCPDPASRLRGPIALTGDVGLALFHYLRGTGSYVLPSRNYGVFTFGCHFETDKQGYAVLPWDGVGRRIVLRQIGCDFQLGFGRIRELRLDARKRWAKMLIDNPFDRPVHTELRARGLWGRRFLLGSKVYVSDSGELVLPIELPASRTTHIEIRVQE
ncbi:MAG: DUF5695 domain-containing protein [Fimbriimonadaceae bacterium]